VAGPPGVSWRRENAHLGARPRRIAAVHCTRGRALYGRLRQLGTAKVTISATAPGGCTVAARRGSPFQRQYRGELERWGRTRARASTKRVRLAHDCKGSQESNRYTCEPMNLCLGQDCTKPNIAPLDFCVGKTCTDNRGHLSSIFFEPCSARQSALPKQSVSNLKPNLRGPSRIEMALRR
jgi:hypothetical protein